MAFAPDWRWSLTPVLLAVCSLLGATDASAQNDRSRTVCEQPQIKSAVKVSRPQARSKLACRLWEADDREYRASLAVAERLRELDQKMDQLYLLLDMDFVDANVRQSTCRTEYLTRNRAYDAVEAVNAGRKKATQSEYDEWHRRIDDYETCYSRAVRSENWPGDLRLRSYDEFHDLAERIQGGFRIQPGADIEHSAELLLAELDEEKRQIEKREGEIATLSRTFRTVEVRRAGSWRPIAPGTLLWAGDTIRTGARGRARIEFHDRDEAANAGPSVITLGPNSVVGMADFVVKFPHPKKSRGIHGVVVGLIRAFTKNWGPSSEFQVRTGTSLCGIRGTDVWIDHNPVEERVTYQVVSGTTEIRTPTTAFTLRGGQQVTVTRGVAGTIVPFRGRAPIFEERPPG